MPKSSQRVIFLRMSYEVYVVGIFFPLLSIFGGTIGRSVSVWLGIKTLFFAPNRSTERSSDHSAGMS